MALVAKWVWSLVGGYQRTISAGKITNSGVAVSNMEFRGAPAPDAFAEYWVHGRSMLHRLTDVEANKRQIVAELEERHSWLSVALPE